MGPLANVAAALRRAPEMAHRLRALVVMGGHLGDDAARGDWNFNSDPEAARVVLESGAPLRLGTLEVTGQASIGWPEVARLRATHDPALVAAAEQLELYLLRGGHRRDVTCMYDPLALTLAYTGEFLQTSPMRLSVAIGDGLVQLGTESEGSPNAEVSVACTAASFVTHLLETIGAVREERTGH